MSAHAKLGASSSHRWTACPGSIKAEEPIQERRSIFADEGSAAHELAELVLTQQTDCQSWVGKTLIENNAVTVDQEMADYVQQYVDYVKSIDGRHEYEQQVHFSDWVPEGFGTADALVLQDTTLYVIDLKYGKGVPVSAFENTQGILYALGAMADYEYLHDIEKVVIVIVQPRMDIISEWVIDKAELLKWGEWLSQRAEAALADNAPRVPGEKQCQFCKAKPTCPELMRLTHDVIASDFDNIDQMANPDTLTNEQLKKALDVKKLIMSWFESVEQHAFDLLEKGEAFPGYKLVEGRSLRQWADEAVAEQSLVELLADDAYEKKLLSVAKAEKLLGKKRSGSITDLISKPRGKPVIVPESDKRPAMGSEAKDFEDFD
jgi:hypothetical protein